ncbi:uncharacterized protein LOC119514838 [Choloepus didactylus]|uniref:uncharacterized protein LOC119514838 n=1 Tax=Choloepus didactylus TaxID=27675 RepID=UPI00189CCDE7|nr:uncharacterized protein LOC119514838 [Choloepus didactylus]
MATQGARDRARPVRGGEEVRGLRGAEAAGQLGRADFLCLEEQLPVGWGRAVPLLRFRSIWSEAATAPMSTTPADTPGWLSPGRHGEALVKLPSVPRPSPRPHLPLSCPQERREGFLEDNILGETEAESILLQFSSVSHRTLRRPERGVPETRELSAASVLGRLAQLLGSHRCGQGLFLSLVWPTSFLVPGRRFRHDSSSAASRLAVVAHLGNPVRNGLSHHHSSPHGKRIQSTHPRGVRKGAQRVRRQLVHLVRVQILLGSHARFPFQTGNLLKPGISAGCQLTPVQFAPALVGLGCQELLMHPKVQEHCSPPPPSYNLTGHRSQRAHHEEHPLELCKAAASGRTGS